MRNRSQKGFTLIELLIVIAIIGILAAVLIPNLLNARQRAFDTAAQTCLKELGVQHEVIASNAPFTYATTGFTYAAGPPATTTFGGLINSCGQVRTATEVSANADGFVATGQHVNGTTQYVIRNGLGVVPLAQDVGYQGTDTGGLAVPALP